MITVRPALNSDGPSVQSIMATCFLQFDGCYYCQGENGNLSRPASEYGRRGGIYLVATTNWGEVVGGAGVRPGDPNDLAPAFADWELSRFYVLPQCQGMGVGSQLMGALMAFCNAHASGSVVAWSDTRFEPAHGFYQSHGFCKLPDHRALQDISETYEYAFYKDNCEFTRTQSYNAVR